MRKQFILSSLAVLGLFAATSCSSEEDMPVNPGNGNTFTVRIPGHISTRGTFGDGTDPGDRATLNNLQWTVFEVSGDDANPTLTQVFSDAKSGAFGESQTEERVTINLAKGKRYQVAFYADDKDNNFVTYANGDITVNYDNGASNTAAEDAFIGKSDVFTVEGAFNKEVTLTRPFAQLNWGTDDTEEKSIAPLISTNDLTGTVTVAQGLFSSMNVISGKVSNEVTNPVTFAAVHFNNLPSQTFPVRKENTGSEEVKQYTLIAMNYLLTGNGTIDCELAFDNGLSPVTVSAAPMKANYRTNIYGSLLTAPGRFNIEVLPGFTDDIDLNQEDKVAEGVYYEKSTKTYILTSKDGLNWLNRQTNIENNNFNGYNVKLISNVDLEGADWTPISKGATFMGVFDGCGYTVSNFNASDPDAAGFFARAYHVKNLNLKNANVTGNYKVGAISGDGICGHFENCHVDGGRLVSEPRLVNGVMDDGNNCGGITGYLSAEPTAAVTGCSVKNMTIIAYRKVGGIAGIANGSSTITGCHVENVNVIANMTTPNYDKASTRLPEAAEIAGSKSSAASLANNTYSNVNVQVIRPNTTTGNVEIGSADAFLALCEMTTVKTPLPSNATLVLTSDIDMKGQTLNPIRVAWNPECKFVLDGKGHTIKNIKLEGENVSLIGGGIVGSVKNLKIDGLTTSATGVGKRFIGVIENIYGDIENVHVKNVNIKSTEGRIGAIVGIHNSGNMTNCSVENVTIDGGWSVGGAVGAINETNNRTYTNVKVKNVNISTANSTWGDGYAVYKGTIVGDIMATGIKFVNCTIEGNIKGLSKPSLPIDVPDCEYIWNGTTVPAGA